MTVYTHMDGPLGPMLLERTERGISRIEFVHADHAPTPSREATETTAGFEPVVSQLHDYFAGTRTTFDLPLAPEGTAFQQTVWEALTTIPYGETWTYGQLAEAIGRPTAARAVGSANGANPLPIVVPCHRVIGSSGTLTGYRGGVRFKQALLDLENGTPSLFP